MTDTPTPLEPGKVREKVTLDDLLNATLIMNFPRADQVERAKHLHDALRFTADVLLSTTPKSADQNAALRHLREAYWTGLSAISLEQP